MEDKTNGAEKEVTAKDSEESEGMALDEDDLMFGGMEAMIDEPLAAGEEDKIAIRIACKQ